MPLPTDTVGTGIVFSFLRPFVWPDIVTMMSHERLEQFW